MGFLVLCMALWMVVGYIMGWNSTRLVHRWVSDHFESFGTWLYVIERVIKVLEWVIDGFHSTLCALVDGCRI